MSIGYTSPIAVLVSALLLSACVVSGDKHSPFSLAGAPPSAEKRNSQEADKDFEMSATIPGMVQAHNVWRRTVNIPELRWSARLASYAQQWADILRNEGCRLRHRPSNVYGENLVWSRGRAMTPSEVVDMWAEERRFYSYRNNRCRTGETCGHYTQVVWKDTREVGCGRASCGDVEVRVCNYDPPGNFIGKHPY